MKKYIGFLFLLLFITGVNISVAREHDDHWVPDVRCGSSTSIYPHNRCGYGVTCRREWCGRFVFRAMTRM